MKPLLILLISFCLSVLYSKVFLNKYNYQISGRVAFSSMLIFTAIGHFVFTKGMSLMIPDVFPAKTFIIYATGILEIAFAICLLFPKYQKTTAMFVIVFLILMAPANIKAALNNLNYQTGALNGNGPSYLWFRIPLQLFFIFWAYLFAFLKNSQSI